MWRRFRSLQWGGALAHEVPAGERVCKALSGRQNHCESAMVNV